MDQTQVRLALQPIIESDARLFDYFAAALVKYIFMLQNHSGYKFVECAFTDTVVGAAVHERFLYGKVARHYPADSCSRA